jgi:hypothetical protein
MHTHSYSYTHGLPDAHKHRTLEYLIHDLLQLNIIQIVTDHHFQDLEELTIGDESVTVHVVHLKSDYSTGEQAMNC